MRGSNSCEVLAISSWIKFSIHHARILRSPMKSTNLASQASYLVFQWISMLALIEAETTTETKSTQTSFKKTAPCLCIYFWKGRSSQLYKVDLPNFFVAKLVGNRLFRCSTAKCYSKRFEECKRSVSTSRSKTRSWARDRCLNKERWNSPQRRDIDPSGCL